MSCCWWYLHVLPKTLYKQTFTKLWQGVFDDLQIIVVWKKLCTPKLKVQICESMLILILMKWKCEYLILTETLASYLSVHNQSTQQFLLTFMSLFPALK